MKFHEFLKELKAKKNLKSTKELYDYLGGEKTLDISVRHFQHVEAGKYQPSEHLLVTVFNNVESSDRKTLILSFFESVLGRSSRTKTLHDFLENNLNPAIETSRDNIWESDRKTMFYSEEQLEFLIKNPDAMRFHKKLILFDKSPAAGMRLSKAKVDRLIELDLVELRDGNYIPSRSIYRIPSIENSGPRQAAKGAEYVQSHLDLFLSKEGSEKQKFVQALQLVKPDVSKRILEQMEAFKKWIQSTAQSVYTGEEVPFIFVGFAKELSTREVDA